MWWKESLYTTFEITASKWTVNPTTQRQTNIVNYTFHAVFVSILCSCSPAVSYFLIPPSIMQKQQSIQGLPQEFPNTTDQYNKVLETVLQQTVLLHYHDEMPEQGCVVSSELITVACTGFNSFLVILLFIFTVCGLSV